jgi:hypothetical protein
MINKYLNYEAHEDEGRLIRGSAILAVINGGGGGRLIRGSAYSQVYKVLVSIITIVFFIQANGHTAAAAVVESDVRQQSSQIQQQNSRLQDKLKRQARTHALLVSIVVVFALSWFPLNVLNLILDIHDIFQVRIFDLVVILSTLLPHANFETVLITSENSTLCCMRFH